MKGKLDSADTVFPPELRTASIVHRWSIVRTLERDNLANHSYYVIVYARNIGRLIGWEGDYENLMMRAAAHDADELITGDIVSPVKSNIVDETKTEAYVRAKMTDSMPGIFPFYDPVPSTHEDADKIIKAADRMDALLFLINEVRLGNSIVRNRTADAERLLHQAWFQLPADIAVLDTSWRHVVKSAIANHYQFGSMGL